MLISQPICLFFPLVLLVYNWSTTPTPTIFKFVSSFQKKKISTQYYIKYNDNANTNKTTKIKTRKNVSKSTLDFSLIIVSFIAIRKESYDTEGIVSYISATTL